MAAQPLPKPQSLRLSRELDAKVRQFARSLAPGEATRRIPMNQALVALIEAGLSARHAETSPKEGMRLALQELDPEWSGRPLADLEPVAVKTRSGRSPVQVLLDRRQ